MESLPPLGTLSQNSPQHLDLLYALAYPSKVISGDIKDIVTPQNRMLAQIDQASSMRVLPGEDDDDGQDVVVLRAMMQSDNLGTVDDLGVIEEKDES
jgi:hypothetical protein